MDPTQNPSATQNMAAGATPGLTPEMPAVNPAAAVAPSLGANPAMSEAPAPTPSEVAGAATSPASNPTVEAASPLAPAGAPAAAPASPLVNPAADTPAAAPAPSPAPEPVASAPAAPNPVATATADPAVSALGESGTPGIAAPVNPIIQPGGATTGLGNMDGLLSTDPIMKPEPLPAPDPVEEELKTPMKAAGLAPGSIGSASGAVDSEGKAEAKPAAGGALPNNPFSSLFKKKQTPSVAFNDPAKETDAKEPEKPAAGGLGTKGKNPNLKINKRTMIILIALAAVLVVVLIVILAMQLNSGSSRSSNNSNNSSTANTPTVEPVEVEVMPEVAISLSCTRKMTAEELTDYKDSLDGMVIVGATFDSDENLIELSNTQIVEYTDTKTGEPMLATESLIRTTPSGIDATNVEKFMLKVANDGGVDTDLKSLTSNYQDLDFTCETL